MIFGIEKKILNKINGIFLQATVLDCALYYIIVHILSHTSPCQLCPVDGCRQPKVYQGQQRSAQTGRIASSETVVSDSASGSSVEST